MKKILVLSACVLGLGIASPADAMMKKPTTVFDYLQQIDSKLDKIGSKINNLSDNNQLVKDVSQIKKNMGSLILEEEVCEDKPSEIIVPLPKNEKVINEQITGDSTTKREKDDYVYMLETRVPVVLSTEHSTTNYNKNHINRVSPFMAKHLVENGYAKYLGNVDRFSIIFLKDYAILGPHGRPTGSIHQKGQVMEFNQLEANSFLNHPSGEVAQLLFDNKDKY